MATKQPAYTVGELVEHPRRPQWGPGRIVAQSDNRLYIFFRDDLGTKAKVILTDLVTLKACDVQTDAVLDELPAVKFDGQDWTLPQPKGAASKARKKAAALAAGEK